MPKSKGYSYEYQGDNDSVENGFGITYYSSGERHEGQYRYGWRIGKGILFEKNGDIFEGEYSFNNNNRREHIMKIMETSMKEC